MTVIRDAVIRIRTERAGSSGGGFEARALAAEAKAAKEAAKAIGDANAELRKNEVQMMQFEIQGVRALANLGRGALELGRGIALLAASSEQDAQKIVQQFLSIEAAVSIAKGATQVIKALTGTVGASAAGFIGYASAVTGAFVAVDYFSESQRRAREEIEKFNQSKENGIRILQQEKAVNFQRASLELERSAIDFQISNLGSGPDRLAALEALRGRLEKDQSNAGLREQFARGRLGDIDAGTVGRAFRPAAQLDLVSAEERQATVLRERVRIEEDILNAKREELRRQEQAHRENPFPSFGGLPGGGITEAAIRNLRSQAQEIERESSNILRELLQQLRSQAEQVAAARRDLMYLER